MQLLENKQQLLQWLKDGAAVLTPNNRLSSALEQDFFAEISRGVIDKPQCLPYNQALILAYEQFCFANPNHNHPLLLNNSQCQHLWRLILREDKHLVCSKGLLHKIMEAFTYCEQWQIAPDNPIFHYTPQTALFQGLWQKFNAELAKNHWITTASISRYLLKNQAGFLSKQVVWACFDSFTPEQEQLQQQSLQTTHYRYDLEDICTEPLVLAAADSHSEYQQLQLWLQQQLQEGKRTIGVVVPELQAESAAITRHLTQGIDPDLFDVSLGKPLKDFPLIAHALTFLRLQAETISNHQATLLLQSPYLAQASEELSARSHYLHNSPLLQQAAIPLDKLIADLKVPLPALAELLINMTPGIPKASPQLWVEWIQKRLQSLGFPGQYLSSENQQCLHRFISLLDEFMQLGLISPSLQADQALDALENLLEDTIFQMPKGSAPIQICGLLEASGASFESLWVTGLSDDCLPQKVRLSAFIPTSLQKSLSMPHSLAARELQFAEQTLQRLRKGAGSLVLSYALLQDDRPCLPSPLLDSFARFTPIPHQDLKNAALVSMTREESYSIPKFAHEKTSASTTVLANQAKCPFKAFAAHRLQAKAAPAMEEGINLRDRGQALHAIMEKLWRILGSQAALLQIKPELLEQHIDKAIRSTQKRYYQEHLDTLTLEVEYQLLHQLVLASLDWEKQRPAFQVTALEEAYTLALGDFQCQVRIDRLDTVGEKQWVIDYKSSLPSTKPWNEDRPQEPQLLLYALLDANINTLLFLQLKTGRVTCMGLSEECSLSGIAAIKKDSTWAEQTSLWLSQLRQLADEFQQGHCPPNPQSPSLCQYCDFSNLCRV